MSAQELREAAALMREHGARGVAWESEWDGDYAADKGWLAPPVALAVADWLESAASGFVEGEPLIDAALAVARTHLGGDQ